MSTTTTTTTPKVAAKPVELSQAEQRMPQSIKALKMFGSPTSWMRSLLINSMRLPAAVLKNGSIAAYDKRIIRTVQFLKECEAGTLRLPCSKELYHVVYHQCTRYNLKKLADESPESLVLISYRTAHAVYDMESYALVTPYTKTHKGDNSK